MGFALKKKGRLHVWIWKRVGMSSETRGYMGEDFLQETANETLLTGEILPILPEISLWSWVLSVLPTHRRSPSPQWSDRRSVKICWMSECLSRLLCWDKSVASGPGGSDSSGIRGWLGLSSLPISSLSALRFLLLLWGIVCFLLPAHQTQFNELFLFSCLPAMKSFPLPQKVHAPGSGAWPLCSFIRIHWWACIDPLGLTTCRCRTLPRVHSFAILYFVALIVICGVRLGGRGQTSDWGEASEAPGRGAPSESPCSPHPRPRSVWRKGGWVWAWACESVCEY